MTQTTTNQGNRKLTRGSKRATGELGITRATTIRIPLTTTPDQNNLIAELREEYGHIYRTITSYALKNPDVKLSELRDKAKKEFGVTSEVAWAIASAARDQVALDERTRAANIASWEWDLESKKMSERKRHKTLAKIERAKTSHVTFGGKALARDVTRGRNLEKWRLSRGFSQFQGRPRGLGNDVLRVERDLSSVTLLSLGGERHVVGLVELRVDQRRLVELFQGGSRSIAALLKPVFSGVGVLRRWELHLSFVLRDGETVDREVVVPGVSRVAGVDLNVGHVDFAVLDVHGNRLGGSSRLNFDRGSLGSVVAGMLDVFVGRGVSVVAVEDLRGLGRGRGHSRGAGVNRVVNQLPTAEFRRLVVSGCARRGLLVRVVRPGGTSKRVPEWSDKYGFGHGGAAALIARRGLGLTLVRSSAVSRGGRLLQSRASARAEVSDWRERVMPGLVGSTLGSVNHLCES